MRRLTPLALFVALSLVVSACASESDDATDDTTTTTTTTTTEPDETTTTEPDDTTTTTTEAVPDVEVPDGFTEVSGDGVTMAVPEEWTNLDLEDGAFEQILDDAVAANPELADVLDDQVRRLAANGAVLFVIDMTDADFSTNVNVLRIPGPMPSDPGELEQTARQGLSMAGGEVTDAQTVSLPAGEALRLAYDATTPLPDGSEVPFSGVQFYVLADAAYVITVSLASGAEATVADEMAESFRVE